MFCDQSGPITPVSLLKHFEKPASATARVLDNIDWLGEPVDAMNNLGLGVYSFDHQDGIGQFEIDFDYADLRTSADRFVFLRIMADTIARKYGVFASFMPERFRDRAGSGAHFNTLLADVKTRKNRFVDKADQRGCDLSKICYHFLIGTLQHLPAIMAVAAPQVNSCKRLVS